MNEKRTPWKTPAKSPTRIFLEEANKLPGFTLLDRLHGYIYGTWIYSYIRISLGKNQGPSFINSLSEIIGWLAPGGNTPLIDRATDADVYHGKVVPLETATQLIKIDQEIVVPLPEQIIPYKTARDIVLKNPEHIVALDCPCRAARENPCTPVDVCLVVGEPFASIVLMTQPDRSRKITQEQAASILQEEHDRGHVHHVFFKEALLDRYYAICNCCSCCCGAMESRRNGNPMLASSGYIAQVDEDLCIACGICEADCQFDAIIVSDEGFSVVSQEECMGCGVCAAHCTENALTLVRDENKPEPLEIETLMEMASTY